MTASPAYKWRRSTEYNADDGSFRDFCLEKTQKLLDEPLVIPVVWHKEVRSDRLNDHLSYYSFEDEMHDEHLLEMEEIELIDLDSLVDDSSNLDWVKGQSGNNRLALKPKEDVSSSKSFSLLKGLLLFCSLALVLFAGLLWGRGYLGQSALLDRLIPLAIEGVVIQTNTMPSASDVAAMVASEAPVGEMPSASDQTFDAVGAVAEAEPEAPISDDTLATELPYATTYPEPENGEVIESFPANEADALVYSYPVEESASGETYLAWPDQRTVPANETTSFQPTQELPAPSYEPIESMAALATDATQSQEPQVSAANEASDTQSQEPQISATNEAQNEESPASVSSSGNEVSTLISLATHHWDGQQWFSDEAARRHQEMLDLMAQQEAEAAAAEAEPANIENSQASATATADTSQAQSTPIPEGNFAVQVILAYSEVEAERHRTTLVDRGFTAYYYENTGGRWPVRVGRFQTKSEAETAKDQLTELGYRNIYLSILN